MIPELFSLSEGEAFRSAFGGKKARTVTLEALRVESEPYHLHGRWYDVFHRAEIDIRLDGARATLVCAPFALPTVVDGLRIEADLVQACAGGLHSIAFHGAVRFAALDAALPWVPEAMVFPMDDYRWRASNYLHTWNGFVHVVERQEPPAVYYHRGEDYGACPNRLPFYSLIDGNIAWIPPAGGDGQSNRIGVRGAELSCSYSHADMPGIRPRAVGDPVVRGETLALTGSTWAGRSGINDPHLHVQIMRSSDGGLINSYPYLTALYRRKFPEEILAVAGGFRFCRTGDCLTLSGEATLLPGEGPALYRWTFADSSSAQGVAVARHYPKPGTYTEQLTVTDGQGRRGDDFVIVQVSDESAPSLPMAFLNHFPMRGLKAGQPVDILCHCPAMPDAALSFGDGGSRPVCPQCTHSYEAPGYYVVALHGKDSQGSAGLFKMGILVEA